MADTNFKRIHDLFIRRQYTVTSTREQQGAGQGRKSGGAEGERTT